MTQKLTITHDFNKTVGFGHARQHGFGLLRDAVRVGATRVGACRQPSNGGRQRRQRIDGHHVLTLCTEVTRNVFDLEA